VWPAVKVKVIIKHLLQLQPHPEKQWRQFKTLLQSLQIPKKVPKKIK